MQGNTPVTLQKWVEQFLKTKNIEIMKWPAQSPDLNPVENLWKILGDKETLFPNYGREWKKSGPRSHQSSVKNYCSDVFFWNALDILSNMLREQWYT